MKPLIEEQPCPRCGTKYLRCCEDECCVWCDFCHRVIEENPRHMYADYYEEQAGKKIKTKKE